MDKASNNTTENTNIKYYGFGIIIGIITTAVFLTLFSIIFLLTELDRAYASSFATISAAIGTFAASYYSSYKIGTKGYRTGFIIALLMFFVITIISFAISKNGFSLNTLFHFIIIFLCGLIGGIFGVNRKSRKKYI